MTEQIKKEIIKMDAIPCFFNTFKIGADETSATSISEIEEMSLELEQTIIEYPTFDSMGKTKRVKLITGVKASLNGKRNHNDVGNNFLAKVAASDLSDAYFYFELNIPDLTVKMPQAIAEMGTRGGAVNDLDKLEVTIINHGLFDTIFTEDEIVEGE